MRVIVFTSNPNLNAKVNSILKNFSDFNPIHNCKSNEEFQKVKSIPDQLFIIDVLELSDDSLLSFCHDETKKIIFLSNENEKYPKTFNVKKESFITKNFKIIEFSALIADILKINEVSNNYVAIEIKHFFKNMKLPCDIFLKFSDNKFLKIAHTKEEITPDFLKKYQDKNIAYFYITNNDFQYFGDVIFSDKLIDSAMYKNTIDALAKKAELLHDIVSSFGISKYVITQIDESIHQFEETLKKTNSEIFALFIKSKGTFLYDHGYLTICFANILLKYLDWKSEAVRNKVMMAAMYHDLAIEDPKVAFNETLSKQEILKLDQATKEIILNHSEKVVTMLQKDGLVPDDVLKMCLNHHEGTQEGYPKSKNSVSLSQIECLFIIAHALAIGLYKKSFRVEKLTIIAQEVTEQYNNGNFRPILNSLKQAIEMGDLKV